MDISERDGGKILRLKHGDRLTVTLEGNRTTGHTWEVMPVDDAVLKQLDEVEYKPISNKLGAPGKFTFRFETTTFGQQTLKLVYHRPWETTVSPAKTFEVTVVVKG